MHADSMGQGSIAELAGCVQPDPVTVAEAKRVRSCMPVYRT